MEAPGSRTELQRGNCVIGQPHICVATLLYMNINVYKYKYVCLSRYICVYIYLYGDIYIYTRARARGDSHTCGVTINGQDMRGSERSVWNSLLFNERVQMYRSR